MKSITNTVRGSLAIKISLSVGLAMLVLISIMSGYLIYAQMKEQRKNMEEILLEKAKLASLIGAEIYGSVLDSAVDYGLLSVEEVFDTDYEAITGYNFKKPKYHTAYDTFTDSAVLGFQDEIAEDSDIVFAVGVDVNGYLPTHNYIFQQPITGDPDKDLVGNRTKRIFDDETGIAAAKNTEKGFKQVYERDTGEVMWDVSSPIYVKGRHWGGFRIGASMSKVEGKMAAQLKFLLGFSALMMIFVVGFVFVALQQSMRPVRELTELADQISAGEALDTPVRIERADEVGRLARSLDRLRASMKAAIERLEM